MTDTNDVNNDGRPGPVSLDLADDRAFGVIVHALGKYACQARERAEERAEEHAYSDTPDPAKALEAFELADIADRLREQIETQVDELNTPKENHP